MKIQIQFLLIYNTGGDHAYKWLNETDGLSFYFTKSEIGVGSNNNKNSFVLQRGKKITRKQHGNLFEWIITPFSQHIIPRNYIPCLNEILFINCLPCEYFSLKSRIRGQGNITIWIKLNIFPISESGAEHY